MLKSWQHIKNFFLIITLLLLTALANAAGSYDSLLQLSGVGRYHFLQIYFSHSQTLGNREAALFEQFVTTRGTADDRFYLQHFKQMAGLKAQKRPLAEFTGLLDERLEAAQKKGDVFWIATLYHAKAEKCRDFGVYDKAIENYLYCFNELKKDPEGRYFDQCYYLYSIALELYNHHDYEKALEISKLAQSCGYLYSPDPDWMAKTCPNLIGALYMKLNMPDSARYWQQLCYQAAMPPNKNDSVWQGVALGYLAAIDYKQGNYAAAIPYYEKGIAFCRQMKIWDNLAAFCCDLADIYLQTARPGMVLPLLNEARLANDMRRKTPNVFNYYTLLGKYYRQTGNAPMAFRYSDSARYYEVIMNAERDSKKKIQAEAMIAVKKKEQEYNAAKEEINRGKWILYTLLTGILLLTVIGILLIKRQNLRSRLRQEHLEKEKIRAEEALHIAQVQIDDYVQHMRQKNELLQQLDLEINKIREQNSSVTDAQLASLEQLKLATIHTEEEWNSFIQLFSKACPGYLQRLKNAYPGLTPAEMRYFVFTKLQFTQREMMAVLGVSAEAIRNIRFRLKKKLGLDDADEIGQLSENI